MSRGNALCHTLQAAPGEFDTRSVPATGDCFFDALDLQLPAEGRADELLSAGQMRDTVADSLNEEILCATTTPALEEIAVDSAFWWASALSVLSVCPWQLTLPDVRECGRGRLCLAEGPPCAHNPRRAARLRAHSRARRWRGPLPLGRRARHAAAGCEGGRVPAHRRRAGDP